MADIVLLFVLKGRDYMSKVLIEVLAIIFIAGCYLILYSAVRVSSIADQRIAEIRSRETFDKEKQLKTNQSTGFHCGECLEVKVDDKWVKTRMEMDIERNWYLVDTPYTGDLEYVRARI